MNHKNKKYGFSQFLGHESGYYIACHAVHSVAEKGNVKYRSLLAPLMLSLVSKMENNIIKFNVFGLCLKAMLLVLSLYSSKVFMWHITTQT